MFADTLDFEKLSLAFQIPYLYFSSCHKMSTLFQEYLLYLEEHVLQTPPIKIIFSCGSIRSIAWFIASLLNVPPVHSIIATIFASSLKLQSCTRCVVAINMRQSLTYSTKNEQTFFQYIKNMMYCSCCQITNWTISKNGYFSIFKVIAYIDCGM